MKRYISIGLILLTLSLLFVNWTSVGELSEEERRQMESEFFTASDIAEMKQAGLTQNEIGILEQMQRSGGISPYTFSVTLRVLIKLYSDENYIPDSFLIGLSMLFWLIVAGLLKLIVQHLFGRRPRGVILFLILLLLLGFFAFMANGTELMLTPVPVIAVSAMLISCILWSLHIKKAGAKKGPYSLREQLKCPRCGTVQSNEVNMFCEKCKAALET